MLYKFSYSPFERCIKIHDTVKNSIRNWVVSWKLNSLIHEEKFEHKTRKSFNESYRRKTIVIAN